MEGGRRGAGIQIWSTSCMSDVRGRGGTTENHSLDQLGTALHLPIYDSKRGGTMEGENPTIVLSSHGDTAKGVKDPSSRQSPILLILTIQIA